MPLTPIAIKTYSALITQTSTNPPTANVLQNTIGTVTWTRTGTGTYKATCTGKFKTGKTWVAINNNNEGRTGLMYSALDNNENDILIETTDFTFAPADDSLKNTPVEIKIYL